MNQCFRVCRCLFLHELYRSPLCCPFLHSCSSSYTHKLAERLYSLLKRTFVGTDLSRPKPFLHLMVHQRGNDQFERVFNVPDGQGDGQEGQEDVKGPPVANDVAQALLTLKRLPHLRHR